MSEPPMTTIASGFCVCAPMPFESAAGKQAEHRHERRHQHGPEPLLGGLARRRPRATCPRRRAAAGSRSRPGSRPGSAMPKIEMKPIAADTEKCIAGDEQREHAAGAGDRDVDEHDERVEPASSPRCRRGSAMSRSVSGMMISRRAVGLVQLVDLAGPLEVRVVGQVHLAAAICACASSMVDCEVAAAHARTSPARSAGRPRGR